MSRLAAVLFGLFLGLALAEVGDRLVTNGQLSLPPQWWVNDADLIFLHNPEVYPQTFVYEGPSPLRAGEVRIACLGGSTTAGYKLRGDQMWPAVAERELRQKGVDAQVLNAAVAGYGSRQLLVRYRRDVAPLSPSYVVIYEGWNKTGALVDPAEFVPFGIDLPGEGVARGALVGLGRHVLLVRHAIGAVNRIEERFSRADWKPDQHHDIWVADMRALVQEIIADGHTPVFVIYPALYHADMTPEELEIYKPEIANWKYYRPKMLWELGRKHDAIRSLAAENHFPVIDVEKQLSGYRGAARARLFFDEMHMTRDGEELVGKIVGDGLAAMIEARRRAS